MEHPDAATTTHINIMAKKYFFKVMNLLFLLNQLFIWNNMFLGINKNFTIRKGIVGMW